MFGTPFYSKTFKNIIGAFGSLFNNITFVRESTTAIVHATATATVNASGVVTSINLLTGSTGYKTPPSISIAGGTVAASAKVTISSAGVVTGFTNLVGGSGYPVSSTQTVVFTGGGQPTTTTAQTIKVPLVYASADKAFSRKTEDPGLNYSVKNVKPKIAFNMTSVMYDVERKIQQLQYISVPVSGSPQTTAKMQVQPAPYNLGFEVYIATASYEDGLQIIEQILPYFNPELMIKTKDFPELNITKDTPVILNDVQLSDNTPDSDYTDSRELEWTLSFTVKTYFFAPVTTNKVITNTLFVFEDIKAGAGNTVAVDTNINTNGTGTIIGGTAGVNTVLSNNAPGLTGTVLDGQEVITLVIK